ncbi:response regulator [Frankia sp. EAN1pec]|uniref:response regulator n=1 Tax=Parafrankia sp. (strain EAN1pec) TaxID=298653 RepID=UPI0002EA1213
MAVHVIVVDDQEPFRVTAASVAEATEGFELVGTVETAEESVAAVAALAPDLVPMDVNLPGMDGLAATRLLRVSGAVSSVVLMSSYDADRYADVATECGAIGYLTKVDLDPDGLQAVWDRGRRRPGPST